jgi:hypothetical protein
MHGVSGPAVLLHQAKRSPRCAPAWRISTRRCHEISAMQGVSSAAQRRR